MGLSVPHYLSHQPYQKPPIPLTSTLNLGDQLIIETEQGQLTFTATEEEVIIFDPRFPDRDPEFLNFDYTQKGKNRVLTMKPEINGGLATTLLNKEIQAANTDLLHAINNFNPTINRLTQVITSEETKYVLLDLNKEDLQLFIVDEITWTLPSDGEGTVLIINSGNETGPDQGRNGVELSTNISRSNINIQIADNIRFIPS